MIRSSKSLKYRTYATLSNIQDFHSRQNLHPWPKAKEPTPQEIFQLTNEDFNLSPKQFNNLIKPIYNKYLKIYHPDISGNLELTNEKGEVMSKDAKRIRFDLVQHAYDILKDPRRRMAYGRSVSTNWEGYQYQSTASSFDAYRMANAHRKKYDFQNDEQFWKASTWEDYYNMKYNRKPPTKEEMDKNKYKILIGVLAVMGITTTIQVILAFDKSAQQQRQMQLQNLRLMGEMSNNYNNVDNRLPPRFSSMRKLLLHRRANIQDSDKLKQVELEDNALLTDFARREVEKHELNE